MLGLDEQAQVRATVERVRRRAVEALGASTDARQAIAFVASLHRSIDRVVQIQSTAGPAPACAPGCSHCCSARVESSQPEALRIALHLHSWSAEAREQLAARLHSKAAAEAEHRAGLPCAFLAQHLCTIYALRPAVCRKAHSLSAQACATAAPTLPQHLGLLLQSEALIAGTHQAYQDLGLAAARQELSAAVLAALARADAAEAWYQDAVPVVASESA